MDTDTEYRVRSEHDMDICEPRRNDCDAFNLPRPLPKLDFEEDPYETPTKVDVKTPMVSKVRNLSPQKNIHIEHSQEVKLFISQAGLKQTYEQAISLIKEHFEDVCFIHTVIEEDFYDEEVRWVQVEIGARGNLPKLSMLYSKFLDKWLESTNTKENNQLRFDYTVVP